jgi:GT2 family glycosyltransferase
MSCIQSVERGARNLRLEIWVVDNASTDGSADAVTTAFPNVKVVANQDNLGFARAVNQVLPSASGRMLLLLNPDAVVEGSAIQKLLEVLDSSPEVGAVGPLVLSPDGIAQYHCASREITLLGQLFWHFRIARGRLHLGVPCGPHGARETERLSGAALGVRREVLERVGLLDERFFMYFEDADWALRIRREGYKIACVMAAHVTHAEGSSARSDPMARSVRALDSELAYFAKNKGTLANIVLRLGIAASTALRAITFDALRALRSGERYRLFADLRAFVRCLSP